MSMHCDATWQSENFKCGPDMTRLVLFLYVPYCSVSVLFMFSSVQFFPWLLCRSSFYGNATHTWLSSKEVLEVGAAGASKFFATQRWRKSQHLRTRDPMDGKLRSIEFRIFYINLCSKCSLKDEFREAIAENWWKHMKAGVCFGQLRAMWSWHCHFVQKTNLS